MANSKRSLFSSLFGRGKKQNAEAEEAAELEARRRLEERIQQVLAVPVEAAKPALVDDHTLVLQEEEESMAEVLPITASALTRRKTPAVIDFWPGSTEVERPYAVNEYR